jgi:hypothetical protein
MQGLKAPEGNKDCRNVRRLTHYLANLPWQHAPG